MPLRTAVLTERLAPLSSRILGNWELGIRLICSFQPNLRPRTGTRTVLGRTSRNRGRPVSCQLCYVGVSTYSNRWLTLSFCIAGCNAALVPIEEDPDSNDTSVTYDTSSYQDLATTGTVIVQQCISNKTRAGGGWELAGIPPSTLAQKSVG